MSIFNKLVLILSISLCCLVNGADTNCEGGVCKIQDHIISPPIAEVVDLKNIKASPNITYRLVVDGPLVPPIPIQSIWEKILNNNLFSGFVAALGFLIYQAICKKYNIDPSHFEGLIMHCFNEVENLGILKKWDGNQKLTEAMKMYDDNFRLAFNRLPSEQEKTFAKYSFATKAYNLKINSKPLTLEKH